VVVSGGQVVGLLYEVTRAGEALGDDPFAVPKVIDISLAQSGPRVLGVETAAEPPTPAPVPPETDNRTINAWISDADEQKIPPEQPLQLGNAYNLKFNLSQERKLRLEAEGVSLSRIADGQIIETTLYWPRDLLHP
jgi:hypothetical protein